MSFNQTEQVTPAESPNELVSAYLAERIEEYRRLVALRREGWQNKDATEHFENERRHADHPDEARKTQFYNMTCKIGQDLNTATRILSSHHHSSRNVAILDLCMAPGGFTTTALRYIPTGHVCGISLPASMGGHEVRVPNWKKNKCLTIQFLDITMLAVEMGVDINTEISVAHPDTGRFSPERPFMDEEFDVVFCGGAVVRNHERAEYRQSCETMRLETSQLVLALQRIRQDATLVLVLHRADAWRSVYLMHVFSGFSDIQLFKPTTAHARKSSFYMVACNVQPQKAEAKQAVEEWKRQWREATLTTESMKSSNQLFDTSEERIELVLREFGQRLVQLSTPIFRTQANALSRAPWKRLN
ncbi:hypothetical protein EDB80DRAFT_780171 [Ilyonectria destructans]|nr:hypothetical protein EDB80DRAFT_780171 [Ilyonectria destructans]